MRDLKAVLLMVVVCLGIFSLASMASSIGTTGSGLFTGAGTFDNTVSNFNTLRSQVNGCTAAADYNSGHSGLKATYANSGCTKIPIGSTQTEAGGLWGSVTNNVATTNGVAIAGSAFIGADGANTSSKIPVWGFNPLLSDLGHNHTFLLNELDFNVTGADTHVIGLTWTGASTVSPDATSYAALIGPLGAGIKWPVGLACADGATPGTGACIQLGVQTTGNTQYSQVLSMLSRTAGAVVKKFTMVGSPTADGVFSTDDATSTFIFNNNNASAAQAILTIGATGGLSPLGVAFASLGTPANGTIQYCNNCANVSNPCTGASTGAIAKRINGAWDCR